MLTRSRAKVLGKEPEAGPKAPILEKKEPEEDSDSEQYSEVDSEDEERQDEYEHPKYWCPESGEVEVGAQTRTTPIALSSITGTYHWFYLIPMSHYGLPDEISYTYRESKSPPPGGLKLSCPPGDNSTVLDRVSGKVDWYGKKGKFTGLLPVKDRRKNDILNYWDIKELQWKEKYEDTEKEGNGLKILEVCDDDGNPFVMFRYNTGAGYIGFQEYLDLLARKQKDGGSKPQSLTVGECERLGIEMRHSEIRARATSESDDTESESDAASSDDAGIDKEDEETSEKCTTLRTDEDNIPEGSTRSMGATKRKASDLDDQETQGPRKLKTEKKA